MSESLAHLQLPKSSRDVREASAELALALFDAARYEESAHAIEQALGTPGEEPPELTLQVWQAQILERAGHIDQAYRTWAEIAARQVTDRYTALDHAQRLLATAGVPDQARWTATEWAQKIQTVALSPAERSSVALLLGRAQLYTGEYAAATEQWRVAIENAPKGELCDDGLSIPKSAQAVMAVAQAYADARRAEAALRRTDEALEAPDAEKTTLAHIREFRARMYEKLSDNKKAAAELSQAGDEYLGSTDNEAAVRVLERAAELDGSDAYRWWLLADAYRVAAYPDNAETPDESTVRKSINAWEEGYKRRRPTADESWVYTVRALTAESAAACPDANISESLWTAITYCHRATLINESGAWAHVYLARFYRLLNMWNTSLATSARALLLAPDNEWALRERAATLGVMDRAEEGLEVMLKVPASSLGLWDHNLLAYLLERVGRWQEAIERVKLVLDRSPDDAWARSLRAECLTRLGQRKDALQEYEAIWQRRSEVEKSDKFRLPWTAICLGHFDEALTYIDKLRRDPTQDAAGMDQNAGLCHLGKALKTNSEEEWAAGCELLMRGITASLSKREVQDLLTSEVEEIRRWGITDDVNKRLDAVLSELRGCIAQRVKELEATKPTALDELEAAHAELNEAKDRGTWKWPGLHLSLAQEERERSDPGAALRYILAALGEESKVPERETTGVRLNLADELRKAGDLDDALAEYQRLLAIVQRGQGVSVQARISYTHVLRNEAAPAKNALVASFAAHNGPARVRSEEESSFHSVLSGLVTGDLIGSVEEYWRFHDFISKLVASSDLTAELRRELESVREDLPNYLSASFKLNSDAQPAESGVRPLILEIGQDLIPADTSNEGWRLLSTDIPAMRKRISSEYGIWLPGILVRSSWELPSNGYLLRLEEVAMCEGTVELDHIYVPDRFERVLATGIDHSELRIANNPVDGVPGCWVDPKYAAQLRGFCLPVWDDPLVFALMHLEVIIQENLAMFGGIEGINNATFEWSSAPECAPYTASLGDSEQQIRLTHVLTAMLEQDLPIVNRRAILETVAGFPDPSTPIAEIVDAIRVQIPETIQRITSGRKMVTLDASSEFAIAEWNRKQDPATAVEYHKARLALRHALAEGRGRPWLRVSSSELRALVYESIRGEYPDMPVFSANEISIATAAKVDAGTESHTGSWVEMRT